MLHLNTVESGTLSLLNKLLKLPELRQFSLVGGTNLALRYGHRISVDLDLFSTEKFEHTTVLESLQKTFGKEFTYENRISKVGIFCFIQNVKVDIIHFPHSLIYPIETLNGIRLYDPRDIAAMKINAVLGRGKKKDFWDLSELLLHYSLDELINFHQLKYPNQMLLISIPQALCYFADAEESENPKSLKDQTWINIKNHITEEVRNYLK